MARRRYRQLGEVAPATILSVNVTSLLRRIEVVACAGRTAIEAATKEVFFFQRQYSFQSSQLIPQRISTTFTESLSINLLISLVLEPLSEARESCTSHSPATKQPQISINHAVKDHSERKREPAEVIQPSNKPTPNCSDLPPK